MNGKLDNQQDKEKGRVEIIAQVSSAGFCTRCYVRINALRRQQIKVGLEEVHCGNCQATLSSPAHEDWN